jgi:two-component system OmpR family sensor kinase
MGRKMKSLLNKSLKQYVESTVIILLIAMPLFYLITTKFYSEEISEILQKTQEGEKITNNDLKQDIAFGVILQYLLIFVVLSLSFYFVIRLKTKKMFSSFYDTIKKANDFNIEKDSIPQFKSTDIKEFNQLNTSLSNLITNDVKRYNLQKHFTENASHELQTPIAIFQSKLDILLQEDLSERQTELVSQLYLVSNRLKHLNKNLLLLAKLDNNQFKDFQDIDLRQQISSNISLYNDLCPKNKIKIIDNLSFSPKVKGNVFLFDSLFNNLLTNAIRNSEEEDEITVVLTENTLSFSNKAKNGSLDTEHLFNRFSYQENDIKGNGLGLAIAKSICEYNAWQIKYLYKESKHFFIISFI